MVMSEKNPKVVALLPMKANSERVVGKNFRSFCGKPLYKWILDTLLEIDDIESVIINTDAEQILAAHGTIDSDRVVIRSRKKTLCGDDTSMNLIIEDDVANVPADLYIMTHTTNPLLQPDTIRGAIKYFKQASEVSKADSLFTVNKIQTRFYDVDGRAINHDPLQLIPTQALEPWYEENSNLYLFSRESFRRSNARIGVRPVMFEMSRLESVDIDTQEDWDFAEVAARVRCEHEGLPL